MCGGPRQVLVDKAEIFYYLSRSCLVPLKLSSRPLIDGKESAKYYECNVCQVYELLIVRETLGL